MKIIIVFFVLIMSFVLLYAQINNPDKPLEGKWDFQMKKIWEIKEAGDDLFGEIQNIRTAKEGKVYIADSKNFKIFIFTKEGKYISSFGDKGEGPGEIMTYGIGEQLFVVNDTIIFAERGKIQYFSLEGKYRKTVFIPSGSKPRMFISENLLVFAPETINPVAPGDKKEEIVLYNTKDQSKKMISQFKPYEKASLSGRRISVRVVVPTITPIMFINYKNGKLYYGMSDLYKINIVPLDKGKTLAFSINDRTRQKVSTLFIDGLKKELSHIPEDTVQKIIKGLPEYASFFQKITIDENGLIYVFLSNPGDHALQAIDIFSPTGKYIYSSELEIKEGLIKEGKIHLKNDYLILAAEDEEGNLKVIKYSIKLPIS